MQKRTAILLATVTFASSLFATTAQDEDKLKQDISRILAHNQIPASDIKAISNDEFGDIKDLHAFIATVKNNPKPLRLLYNKDKIIIGDVLDRNTDKSLLKKYILKDKAKLEKVFSLQHKKELDSKVNMNKKTIAFLSDEFKDLTFKIKGDNSKGKVIYLVTDPNCPYCQQYEKNRLPIIKKESKEIIVVPIFLRIQGHETSPMRSSWLLSKYKDDKNANMLKLLHKASNINDETYKEVDEKFAKEKIKKINDLLSKKTIKGTPTIFDSNGVPVR